MLYPFTLLAIVVSAIAQPSMPDIIKTCSSATATIQENHLHMTSIVGAQQKQECSIKLMKLNSPIYLEFERYGGRKPDERAWTNITFVGTPNVTVTINNNAITVGDKTVHLNTYSKLEKSMSLLSVFKEKYIQLEFAPVGSTEYGILNTLEHVSKNQIVIATETETGMEQVLRSVGGISDKSRTTSVKTIHELERRIIELDKDLTPKIDNILKRLDKHHQRLLEKKQGIGYKTVFVIIGLLLLSIGKYTLTKKKKYIRLD